MCGPACSLTSPLSLWHAIILESSDDIEQEDTLTTEALFGLLDITGFIYSSFYAVAEPAHFPYVLKPI